MKDNVLSRILLCCRRYKSGVASNTNKSHFLSELPLRINFLYILFGNIVYAGCQWAMLVVIAKMKSPDVVGQFALGLAISTPVVMFTNLQLRVVLGTDTTNEYSFGNYLCLRLISGFIAFIVIVAITIYANYKIETQLIIITIGIAKIIESISDVYFGLLQKHERMDRLSISMMIKGPLSVIALFLGILITGQMLFGVIGLVVIWALILVTYDIPSGRLFLENSITYSDTRNNEQFNWPRMIKTGFDANVLGRLVWLSLPLGFVMMLISLKTNIPRFFIENHLGERALGIYAAISSIMAMGTMVVTALGSAAYPRMAKYYGSELYGEFIKFLLKLVLIGLLLGVGGILVAALFGWEILKLFFGQEYASYQGVLVWVMLAGGIYYVSSFLGYAMSAVRYFRIQVPLTLISVFTICIASFVLIKKFGLLGAAWAACLGFAVEIPLKSLIMYHALKK